MKLYKFLKRTKAGEAFIRFVKFILSTMPFAADIEASISQMAMVAKIFQKVSEICPIFGKIFRSKLYINH
jgi:hypothetical protein